MADLRRPGLTDEELNAVDDAARLNQRRTLRDYFLATFGPPDKRTPMGSVMLEHLEKFAHWGKPVLALDSNGHTDIYRTGIAEGRREMMQAIHDAIEWRESDVNTRR
ncbi:MAG TPA: hypothetical protein VMU47_06620 [Caldimonas sp.]|nr:hypothetical protein [Caldimonas sp.]